MGSLSPVHWLIVLIVLVVLFGAKRLPDASRSLGRSLRIFKSEIKDLGSDGDKPAPTQAAAPAPQALPTAPPVIPPVPQAGTAAQQVPVQQVPVQPAPQVQAQQAQAQQVQAQQLPTEHSEKAS
ncbi:Sec-independent protein translocase subunit TatA [Rhodococcus sp. X156]|uniref:Sec-independent protein translocase subunit TatA n=1 Tax=Rhodococcus sp. X156 TaxID=2499145 RepID=UPI000FD7BF1E|nr:Sec-independent protein translocase subunit TatA [Rhodococcus sp. X156]